MSHHPTAFNSDATDDANGSDSHVAGNNDNASISTKITQRRKLTSNGLIHDLESAVDKPHYNSISLPTTAITFTCYLKN